MRACVTGLCMFGLAMAAQADQFTATTRSQETGTIRNTGPNGGCSGDQYVNVQGVNNADFASYAVMRFDVSQAQVTFDAIFGAGNWTVSSVEVALTQTAPPFGLDGLVDIYYSDDDLTDIKSGDSPLIYPFFDDQGNPDLSSEFILQTFYAQGNLGDIDTIDLSGSASLIADVENAGDGVATLVMVDGDPDVAASYRGQNPYRDRSTGEEIATLSPQLIITANGTAGGVATLIGDSFSDETGTIQTTGPRGPCNGDRYFNVEGVNNGEYASYGVIRFDLADMRASFDAAFGAGNWSVNGVQLDITQNNAAFSLDGLVDWYFSTDDDTDVKSSFSPLLYPFMDDQGNTDLPADFITQTFFTVGTSGDIDSIDMSGNAALKTDIESDASATVTIVVSDADPDVAATYRGQDAYQGRQPPRLLVTAQEGGGNDCTGKETVKKAKCKLKNGKFKLTVKLIKGVAGDSFTITLLDNEQKSGTLNSKGKGKAKFKDTTGGPGTASAVWGCGATGSKDYDCQ